MASKPVQAQIVGVRLEAPDTISLELRPGKDTQSFSAVEAGAHLDLHLGNGLIRSYSLINPGDTERYVIAVKKDASSRGGSVFVHDNLRVGQYIEIGVPRNHFALDESAEHTVLVAGGIGITPIYAMLQRLQALGKSAHIIYCARSKAEAAFFEQVEKLVATCPDRLAATYHFSDEQQATPNLASLLSAHHSSAHYYCCGPTSMLDAFEQTCEELGYANVHLERFGGATVKANVGEQSGYTAVLKKSGIQLEIQPGKSLLDTILEAGVNAEYSCKEGVCGACEARVISGEVDHHDFVLSKQEQATNRSIMICVSGCKSDCLVLDL